MILLVLINGALQILCKDRTAAGGGFGWDGDLYGRLAIDFQGTIRAGIISERV
jgi:hypothetical protein